MEDYFCLDCSFIGPLVDNRRCKCGSSAVMLYELVSLVNLDYEITGEEIRKREEKKDVV